MELLDLTIRGETDISRAINSLFASSAFSDQSKKALNFMTPDRNETFERISFTEFLEYLNTFIDELYDALATPRGELLTYGFPDNIPIEDLVFYTEETALFHISLYLLKIMEHHYDVEAIPFLAYLFPDIVSVEDSTRGIIEGILAGELLLGRNHTISLGKRVTQIVREGSAQKLRLIDIHIDQLFPDQRAVSIFLKYYHPRSRFTRDHLIPLDATLMHLIETKAVEELFQQAQEPVEECAVIRGLIEYCISAQLTHQEEHIVWGARPIRLFAVRFNPTPKDLRIYKARVIDALALATPNINTYLRLALDLVNEIQFIAEQPIEATKQIAILKEITEHTCHVHHALVMELLRRVPSPTFEILKAIEEPDIQAIVATIHPMIAFSWLYTFLNPDQANTRRLILQLVPATDVIESLSHVLEIMSRFAELVLPEEKQKEPQKALVCQVMLNRIESAEFQTELQAIGVVIGNGARVPAPMKAVRQYLEPGVKTGARIGVNIPGAGFITTGTIIQHVFLAMLSSQITVQGEEINIPRELRQIIGFMKTAISGDPEDQSQRANDMRSEINTVLRTVLQALERNGVISPKEAQVIDKKWNRKVK